MKIITFEEHYADEAITKASKGVMLQQAPYLAQSNLPSPAGLTDLGTGRLADMDKNGIDMQVLSSSNAPQFLPPAEAVPLCMAANDQLAAAVQAHPDRFAAFALLPMCDPEAAAAELERTVTQLHFKGALITGRPSGEAVFLDDPRYGPVFAMAEKWQVPVYIHPGVPAREVQQVYYNRLDPVVSALLSVFGWGWHAEAGIQVVRMILAGVFDKYPNLQLISGHWGEMVPFFLARLDATLPKATTGLQRTITEYYRSNVYVTPSGMFTLPHFLFIVEVLGADRILYSVDYPYLKNEGARAFLENAPISQEDKEKIANGNAVRLLGL